MRAQKSARFSWANRIGESLRRFFGSVRLALFLILFIAALSLIGALVLQAPADIIADPAIYAAWVRNVAQPALGDWAYLLSFLHLLDVFHSPWFLGAGLLLAVNIFVCSLNRWKRLRAVFTPPPTKHAVDFYSASANHIELSSHRLSLRAASNLCSDVLVKNDYKVLSDHERKKIYLAADKNRYFVFGTYVTHMSLILLILGFTASSYTGFHDNSFIVPEGSVRQVGHGTNLSLKLESFVDDYYSDGTPKDYCSSVVVYDNGCEVKRAAIRVNHPLDYSGTRFYQSFFGPAAKVKVKSAGGDTLYQDCVALSETAAGTDIQSPAGSFTLPGNLIIHLVAPADSADRTIGDELLIEIYDLQTQGIMQKLSEGTLSLGTAKYLSGFEITYLEKARFSGFQISRDPALTMIWIACVTFILGVCMVLYFPYRQVWALVLSQPRGGSRILLRSTSARNIGAERELNQLAESIKGQFIREE